MRIQRLELIGFKSFVHRTVLEFAPGVTAIVGPNGCGKSNIVDAIRWVLGEQSAKHLRGQAMEDVIFAGNERRPPLGMAEVSLTFVNEEAASVRPEIDLSDIPAEIRSLPEITVTRRYYRSGESEYFLNRAPCRLKDITELFLGTGVGTKAYAIIEQGRVEQLVGAKPEERRWFVEEAAGTTLYRSRRQAAERKMERTRENLARVGDVLREVERQIRALERQAARAAEYRKLADELREVELQLASYRWGRLQHEEGEREAKIAALLSAIRTLEAGIAEGEASRAAISERRAEVGGRVERLGSAAWEARTRLESLRERRRWLEREIADRTRTIEDAVSEIATLEGRVERLGGEVSELLAARGEHERELREMEPSVSLVSQRMEELREELRAAENELERDRAVLVSLLTEEARTKNELAGIEKRIRELEKLGERLSSERERVVREAAEAEARVRAGEAEVGELREKSRGYLAAAEGCSERLRELELRRKELEQATAGAEERWLQARSRLESLEEIQRRYEGYRSGVRATMLRGQSAEGVLGVVADVVRAPLEYERAVAAVLGERLQCVIVAEQESALGAIERLRAEAAGRGSFIPRAPRRWGPPVELPGDEGARLLDLVRVDEEYRPVVETLLSDAVLVPDLTTALRVWRRNGLRVTLVTPDGDVVDPTGVISGGSERPPEEEILARGREIEQLRESLHGLTAEFERAARGLERVQAECEETSRRLRELQSANQDATLALVAKEKELERLRGDVARWLDRSERLDAELGRVRAEAESLAEERERARAALGELERRTSEVQECVRRRQDLVTELRARVEALGEEALAGRLRLAEERSRLEVLARQAEELARHGESFAAQIDRARRRLARATDEKRALEEELARLSSELEETEREARRSEERFALERATLAEVETEAREAETKLGRLRQELDDRRRVVLEAEKRLAEVRLERSHLEKTIGEKYGVQLREDARSVSLPEEARVELEARLGRLQKRLSEFGEVSTGAVEELRELEARAAFLRSQKEDLEKSLADLEKTIAKLNRVSRSRFRATFEEVDRQFRTIFPRLFGGGEARLVLTDEKDPLEAGVEVVVRPPGKKLESVTLLSGGEKALVAVSLLFSLFLIRPTPFCFLDEVDAPLDDANVERFVEMVRELRDRSQFVLVTHNKRTMEAADCLYGVTMEEPGVSKVISVAVR
ncbi:MAG: chromosome partition protein Smc [Candidatus Binatia bacterium]|nr:MAG: chromosome partition protein Smc [Candidatus Binatia bacterium]